MKESHEGGLMGHFGIDKTLVLLKEKFYWPHMKKDVHKHSLQEKWPKPTDAFFLQTLISVGKSQKYFYLQVTNVGKTQPFVPTIIWCK